MFGSPAPRHQRFPGLSDSGCAPEIPARWVSLNTIRRDRARVEHHSCALPALPALLQSRALLFPSRICCLSPWLATLRDREDDPLSVIRIFPHPLHASREAAPTRPNGFHLPSASEFSLAPSWNSLPVSLIP